MPKGGTPVEYAALVLDRQLISGKAQHVAASIVSCVHCNV